MTDAAALPAENGAPLIALPSRGRLREQTLELLDHAGYPTAMFHGSGSRARVAGIEFIEMRPRDAGAWLAAGRLDGAFLSTDLAMEHELEDRPTVDLGYSRSDLVVASRDDDGRTGAADLAGATVATHLPALTRRWFAERGVEVQVVDMGGSLEGICAAGLAEAIVDLRETGTSLATNRLRVLEVMRPCQANFVHTGGGPKVDDLLLRIGAVLDARQHRYVMLHIGRDRLDDLRSLLPGLASPTVLPLAGRDDLVAVHILVSQRTLWENLGDLRALGASGIVALPPEAVVE